MYRKQTVLVVLVSILVVALSFCFATIISTCGPPEASASEQLDVDELWKLPYGNIAVRFRDVEEGNVCYVYIGVGITCLPMTGK